MDTNDVPNRIASMWEPMSKPIDVGVVGKTLEEIFETTEVLSKIGNSISRALIQGINGRDPADPILGITNKNKLEDEIGDVLAKLAVVMNNFDLDTTTIMHRAEVKHNFSEPWFVWLAEKSRTE